jgi:hypothetical protein
MTDVLVLNTRAASVLGSLLQESGDLLPLDCESQELWMFNATRVVDALDEERTAIVRDSLGGLMFVERYVFRPSVVSGLSALSLPYAPGAYCS